MTTLVKKKFLSESVRLAQSFAVEHYIDYDHEDQRPNELIFEQLSTLSFEEAEVSATGNYEFDHEDDVCNRMRTMATDVQFAIESFSDNATKGLKLAMIAGEQFFDYETIDLPKLAVLGSLLRVTVNVNDLLYKLDESTAKWYCTSYPIQTVEIDFADGAEFMPKLEGDKRVIFASNEELSFIVDQAE